MKCAYAVIKNLIFIRLQGDLILEVPHLIEAVTIITDTTKKPEMLTILDTNT